MFKYLDWYNVKSSYGCYAPRINMNSNNLDDAKQECNNNPSCVMFEHISKLSEGSEFNFCTDSSKLQVDFATAWHSTILYVKNGN